MPGRSQLAKMPIHAQYDHRTDAKRVTLSAIANFLHSPESIPATRAFVGANDEPHPEGSGHCPCFRGPSDTFVSSPASRKIDFEAPKSKDGVRLV
jgi:hypothetical protein